MSVPAITGVQLAGDRSLPLLVCGPSLGTSATALWSAVAQRLGSTRHVVGWDLPGHGTNQARDGGLAGLAGLSMAELGQGVLDLVDKVLIDREEPGGRFAYAGDSVGGAVGLQLLLDAPDQVSSAVLLCTAAKLGEPAMWQERAALVRVAGTPVLVPGSVERWFPPGFLHDHADVAAPLLHSLQEADRFGYAAVCDALAGFDVRDRLAMIERPVLAVAGAEDVAAPVDALRLIAEGVSHGRLVVLDGVAHLAPVEAPDAVARLIGEHP